MSRSPTLRIDARWNPARREFEVRIAGRKVQRYGLDEIRAMGDDGRLALTQFGHAQRYALLKASEAARPAVAVATTPETDR